MCGVAGIFSVNNINEKNITDALLSLNHRGPDNSHYLIESSLNIAIGHTRLSIQDLSSSGNQPMKSSSYRYIISFNGEIYNHLDLRSEILNEVTDHKWKGTSDTETLIEAINIWGIEHTLKKIKGMFAFALIDMKKKVLYLARDRFGEKPMYYSNINNEFCFASELQAIYKLNNSKINIDQKSINLFLNLSYIPTPKTIYENVFKLEPGYMLEIPLKNDFKIHKKSYWDIKSIFLKGKEFQFKGSEKEAGLISKKMLQNSVESQLISDVPVGAFLSGGIDSSTVVALMKNVSKSSVKTFTIGFEEENFSEAYQASLVAKHIGTDHHELIITHKDLINIVPSMGNVYDEPFADSSQIPTFFVSKLAKEKVSVALTGDGGDELFAGYNRYSWANEINITPQILKKLYLLFFKTFGIRNLNLFYHFLTPFINKKYQVSNPDIKLRKLKNLLTSSSDSQIYLNLISSINHPNNLISSDEYLNDFKEKWEELSYISDFTEKMMIMDTKNYMTDDILCKVDRAGMNVSLETRMPFLDHEIFSFLWSLPNTYKLKSGNKRILKDILSDFMPSELYEKPKTGFSIPLSKWLSGPLREWAEDTINDESLKKQNYFNIEKIKNIWSEFLAGNHSHQNLIWNVIILINWLSSKNHL